MFILFFLSPFFLRAIGLSAEKEPESFSAIRFGCVLENVGFTDGLNRVADYSDNSITENTRACYPIEHIPNIVTPCKHSTTTPPTYQSLNPRYPPPTAMQVVHF